MTNSGLYKHSRNKILFGYQDRKCDFGLRLKNQSTYAVSHLFYGPFLFVIPMLSFLWFFFPPYPCYIEKQVQVFLAGLPELISYQANLFELIATKNN